ncbi:MAG TPA: hypothetical protein ENJ80_00975 [Gammaproteobacteria bacterium]|nr:hypothetical protein [Gammaproteobacteria bacterium]
MHQLSPELITFIVLTVLLFIMLGIAMLVIVDHKAKIPGAFHNDPFSISGLRRGHPVISFLTTLILGSIILALLFELTVAMTELLGFPRTAEQPQLLQKLGEQRFTERMRHFHNEPEEDLVNLGKKQVCFYCHGDFPHSKQRMVRTLLNMHTQFVGCMTCHTDPRKVPEESYEFAWLNYSGIDVTGPHYGTSINPDTGFLVDTDDYYSKIVIYDTRGEEKKLLEITEQSPDAQEFLAVRDTASDQDMEALRKHFHAQVSPKGRFCSRCHTPEDESYLPFRQLGFSDRRVGDVTNLNLVGIVEKYREFYLPKLFSSDLSLPDSKALVGESHEAPISNEEAAKPRAWWRKSTLPPSGDDNASKP